MTHDRHKKWGEPIQRGKVEPRKVETEEKKPPDDYLEKVQAGSGALEEAQKIARKRTIASRVGTYMARAAIVTLGVAEARFPVVSAITDPLKSYIKTQALKTMSKPSGNPQDKALKFLSKFAKAEGIFKYVYGIMAILLFGIAFVAPEYGLIAVAVAYAFQTGKAYYEQKVAEEE